MSKRTLDSTMRHLGLSDARLAEKVGTSRMTIWSIRVRGQVPKSDKAARILSALKEAADLAPDKREEMGGYFTLDELVGT